MFLDFFTEWFEVEFLFVRQPGGEQALFFGSQIAETLVRTIRSDVGQFITNGGWSFLRQEITEFLLLVEAAGPSNIFISIL